MARSSRQPQDDPREPPEVDHAFHRGGQRPVLRRGLDANVVRSDERPCRLTFHEVTGAGDAVVAELHMAFDDVPVQDAR